MMHARTHYQLLRITGWAASWRQAARVVLLGATVAAGLGVGGTAEAAGSGVHIVGLAGKCLTARARAAEGAAVVLSTCQDSSAQAWQTPGARALRVLGRCLDAGDATTSRTPVRVRACNRSSAQQWQLSGGRLMHLRSGLCVDVRRAQTTDGTPALLYPCRLGKPNQRWLFPGQTETVAAVRRRDFFDDFTGGSLGPAWGRYGWGRQAPGNGAMGLYDVNNVYAGGGMLNLRTQYTRTGWTSAGISSGRGFSAVMGEWQIRARFDRARGIGFAFLLYPDDGTWPPEIDIAEGKVSGPTLMSTLHWGPQNQQAQRWNTVPDMTKWHTYGVTMSPGRITYTLDGRAWASFANANVPTKHMWIGMQTGAHHCPSKYECVAGNHPNRYTPVKSAIQVDWIAHYATA